MDAHRSDKRAMTNKELKEIPCPNCGRRGLYHPRHPHAFTFKEYDKAQCRFCHKTYKIKEKK